MDAKLLDSEGKPLLRSEWEYVIGGKSQQMVFRVRSFNGVEACLTCIVHLGKKLDPPQENHAFSWKRMVAEWKWLSNPDPDAIPVLVKKTRHGVADEERMHLAEKNGNFHDAKVYALRAAQYTASELEMTREELAVEERRIIRPVKLEKMSAGDRASIEIQGVKPFVHYLDQMQGWLWYGK